MSEKRKERKVLNFETQERGEKRVEENSWEFGIALTKLETQFLVKQQKKLQSIRKIYLS